MAWDDAVGEMLLVTDAGTLNKSETWTWAATHWQRQASGDLGISVFGDAMAYDPLSNALLLISPSTPDNQHSSTMSWNGSRWRVLISDGPEVDGIALDPQANALLACGTPTYSELFAVDADCWQWTGTGWLPIQTAVPPVPVKSEVADLDHARILMFGWLVPATQGQPQPVQVWSWDGTIWTHLG